LIGKSITLDRIQKPVIPSQPVSDTGQAKKKQAASGPELKALIDFVLAELNIGLQFAELALDSYLRNRDADGHRQKAAAIHALQTAQDFLPQVDPTESQRVLMERRLLELTIAVSRLDSPDA
jgi:hypothetical protein